MTAALARLARIRGIDPDAPVEVPRFRCGHERAGANIRERTGTHAGKQECRTCRTERQRQRMQELAAELAAVTPEVRHRRKVLIAAGMGRCRHGHHLDETTTYWSSGRLVCGPCNTRQCADRRGPTARRTA